jgi:hypothetical protein
MNKKTMDTILEIPYYSQYRDILNTQNAHRSCGMTCIKMTLDYYEKESETLENLVSRYIVDEDAYGPSGWKHDFFVNFLKSFGLNAYRKEQIEIESGIQEIKESIENKSPVIVSVEQRLFDKKLFHMVLMTGIRTDENGTLLGFFYNDPGRLTEQSGAKQYVSREEFTNYWRKMAIFTNS